ncbi:hypothetical protein [Atopobium fossor]|uniref:hypothetical protein n=1 Tax=Atopobium fossor TaxID=39487 RepID=UPI00047F17EE|nr:hypothetical protein [Atopobium fossor]
MSQASSMKVCNLYKHVYKLPYCAIPWLAEMPSDYHNHGIYGWNCDIYTHNEYDIAITTGYRNTRGQRVPQEIINEFATYTPGELYTHSEAFDMLCEKLSKL